MKKKIFILLLSLAFISSAHAAWYAAPIRWFNQGIAWMRQSSYNAYQKMLALAGYQAYQQQQPIQPVATNTKPQILQEISSTLLPDVEAALTVVQLLTLLEKQWQEEIDQKRPKYPEFLHQQQMGRYPALQQEILKKYPALNSLSKYDLLIAAMDNPHKNQNVFSYFPSIANALNKLSPQDRAQIEPNLQKLIIWIALAKRYFDNPFTSGYSLSLIYDHLRTLATLFAHETGSTFDVTLIKAIA